MGSERRFVLQNEIYLRESDVARQHRLMHFKDKNIIQSIVLLIIDRLPIRIAILLIIEDSN
jgi:hypothetical protein